MTEIKAFLSEYKKPFLYIVIALIVLACACCAVRMVDEIKYSKLEKKAAALQERIVELDTQRKVELKQLDQQLAANKALQKKNDTKIKEVTRVVYKEIKSMPDYAVDANWDSFCAQVRVSYDKYGKY